MRVVAAASTRRDALQHVVRLARVLRQARGAALLLGVCGGGKSSVARFTAALCDMPCYAPEGQRALSAVREQLKALMVAAGVEGRPGVWLLQETVFTDVRGLLEDVASLLSCGEVAGGLGGGRWVGGLRWGVNVNVRSCRPRRP